MESAHNIYFEKEDILKYICVYEVNVAHVKRFISSKPVRRCDLKVIGFTQTRGPWLKTTWWLQGPRSLSSFRGRIKWILGIPGDIVPSCNGAATLRQFNPIHQRGHEVLFLISFVLFFYCLNAFLWQAIAKPSLRKLLRSLSFPVQNTVKNSWYQIERQIHFS